MGDVELVNGGFALKERPAGDLTLLMLAKVLAPKKDTKLAKLFESILIKQPLEMGLKKASSKSLERLNSSLPQTLEKHLKKVFPKRDRKTYRAVMEAYREKRWEDLMLAHDEFKERALVGPNLDVFFAMTLAGLEEILETPKAQWACQRVLEITSRGLGSSPFAVDAQERLGHYLLDLGQTEAAVDAFATLRDDFGWQPGVAERATKLMKSVKRK